MDHVNTIFLYLFVDLGIIYEFLSSLQLFSGERYEKISFCKAIITGFLGKIPYSFLWSVLWKHFFL